MTAIATTVHPAAQSSAPRNPATRRLALSAALAAFATLAPASAVFADSIDGAAKPTVVLVHGAFADESSWNKVVPLLHSWGANTVTVRLPLTSLHDDVEATRRAVQAVPGPVVLVGHSWGGSVITEAGLDDKVTSLVYIAAFAPDAGQSTAAQGQGYPVPPGLSHLSNREGLLWLDEPGVLGDFAQDLRRDRARELFQTQLPIRATAFDEPIQQAAWKAKPSWYLVTREDHMIAPELQTATARRIGATIEAVGSSHVAMLSKPREVAYVILEAAGLKKAEPAPHEGG